MAVSPTQSTGKNIPIKMVGTTDGTKDGTNVSSKVRNPSAPRDVRIPGAK